MSSSASKLCRELCTCCFSSLRSLSHMTNNTHLIAFTNLNPLPSLPHPTSPTFTHLHAAHCSAHRTPEPSFSVISYDVHHYPPLPSTASPVPILHLLSSHPCWTLSHLTSYFHSPLLLSKTQTSFLLSSAGTSSTAELPSPNLCPSEC